MNGLLSLRGRAEELDAVVSGRVPVDDARPELAELAGIATLLREHEQVAPRAEFAASLRDRLLVEARAVLSAGAKPLALPVRGPGSRERRLVAAATVVVFVGGTAGMAAASQDSLPGEALYPIKRVIEWAEAGLSADDASKGHDLLSQAQNRLGEAERLQQSGAADSREVPGTIDDFSSQAQAGADLLLSSYGETRDRETIRSLREFTVSSLALLEELARSAPPAAQADLADAAQLLRLLDQRALGICGQCAAELPPLELPGSVLSAGGVEDAAADLKVSVAPKPTRTAAPGKDSTQFPKGHGLSGAPETTAAANTAHSGPAGPGVRPGDGAKRTVKPTKKDVGGAVKDVTDSVDDLVGTLVPGLDDTVDDLTDPVSGGLLP